MKCIILWENSAKQKVLYAFPYSPSLYDFKSQLYGKMIFNLNKAQVKASERDENDQFLGTGKLHYIQLGKFFLPNINNLLSDNSY